MPVEIYFVYIYFEKNPNYLQLLIKKIKQMIACYKIPNNSYTLNKPNSFISHCESYLLLG